MLLSLLVCIGFGIFYSLSGPQPQYIAKMSLLIELRPSAGQGASYDQSLVLASQQLLPTYETLIQSQSVQKQAYSMLPQGLRRISGPSISVSNPKLTQILNVSVTSSSSKESSVYAKDLISAFRDKARSIIGAQSIEIVDEPTVASTPSRSKVYIASGVVLGLLVGVALAILVEFVRDRVRNEEDAERAFDVRVLGSVPRS